MTKGPDQTDAVQDIPTVEVLERLQYPGQKEVEARLDRIVYKTTTRSELEGVKTSYAIGQMLLQAVIDACPALQDGMKKFRMEAGDPHRDPFGSEGYRPTRYRAGSRTFEVDFRMVNVADPRANTRYVMSRAIASEFTLSIISDRDGYHSQRGPLFQVTISKDVAVKFAADRGVTLSHDRMNDTEVSDTIRHQTASGVAEVVA